MSMNLHCEEVDLWQTPTSVTYMCYSNGDGGWKGILYRYREWVKGTLSGAYKDVQEAEWACERVREHLAQFDGKKKLTFSIDDSLRLHCNRRGGRRPVLHDLG